MKLLREIILSLSLATSCISFVIASYNDNSDPGSLRSGSRRLDESCDSIRKLDSIEQQ